MFKGLKIVIPGDCPVKKNTASHIWYRVNKATGVKLALDQPIMYYTDFYKNWAKASVKVLIDLKRRWSITDKDNIFNHLPLQGEYFVTFWIFRSTNVRADLSNLFEAPQDLLIGRVGNFLPARIKETMFQILSDDNSKIIKNHGGSQVFYDPVNPRTEIYITPFDLKKSIDITKIIHKDLM